MYIGEGGRGGPHFILMLSVRILGGEGWHLFTSGSLAAPPSPPVSTQLPCFMHLQSTVYFYSSISLKKRKKKIDLSGERSVEIRYVSANN